MPRLNLSVPVQMDDVLEDLCLSTGRTKASYVIDAMSRALPFWRRDLGSLGAVRVRVAAPVEKSSSGPVPVGSVESVVDGEGGFEEPKAIDADVRPVRLPAEQKGQYRMRLKQWQEQR